MSRTSVQSSIFHHWPVAAQSFVKRRKRGRGRRFALRRLILSLQHRSFGIKHASTVKKSETPR
jgi:hypothetical protein